MPPTPRRRDVPWVVPSWQDPIARAATGFLGGPTGRYAVVGARGLAGVAATVVLLGAVTLAVGVWTKGHCLMKGWSAPDHFWRACYSDLPVVHVSSMLSERMLPWAGDAPSTQPPLSGLVMWLLALVSPEAGPGLASQQWIFGLWAVLCVVLLAAAVLAVVALQPRRPWQATQLALSPVLALLVMVSTDLLGVTLMLLGLWAWRRERPWVAGVLLGLALLVRPFPLLVLAAILIVGWRHRRVVPALQTVVGAVLSAVAVLLALVSVEPQSLTALQQWWGQSAGYGALQVIPQLMGTTVPGAVTVSIAVAGWLGALALGAWLGTRPGRPVGVAALAAAMMVVVVLTAPSLSAQSGLWVLPFLALSARMWWEHLVWALAETVHFVSIWLHLAFTSDPGRALPPEAYALAVLVRIAAWTWILWRIAQETPPEARRRRVPRERAAHGDRPPERAISAGGWG